MITSIVHLLYLFVQFSREDPDFEINIRLHKKPRTRRGCEVAENLVLLFFSIVLLFLLACRLRCLLHKTKCFILIQIPNNSVNFIYIPCIKNTLFGGFNCSHTNTACHQ